MSLTSYRAAPPRAGVVRDRGRSRQRRQTDQSAAFLRQKRRALVVGDCKEADVVLGRSGDDLLSRVLRHSTIGAEEFNGRVRDGIGFGLLAQITGPAKNKIFVGKQWVKEGRARS